MRGWRQERREQCVRKMGWGVMEGEMNGGKQRGKEGRNEGKGNGFLPDVRGRL